MFKCPYFVLIDFLHLISFFLDLLLALFLHMSRKILNFSIISYLHYIGDKFLKSEIAQATWYSSERRYAA